MKIEILNGLIVDPKAKTKQKENLFIKDDKINSIGRKPRNFRADLSIDANNQIVCPGFVELSAEINPTKDRFEENLIRELDAAAKGGFTSICVTPSKDRPLDTVESINLLNQYSNQQSGPKVFCLGALTVNLKGEQLTEMYNLKKAGCLGVSNGDSPISNTTVLRNALLYAKSFGLKVYLNSQEKWLSHGTVVKEGISSIEKGLPASPESSELIELFRNVVLIDETGVEAHLKSITSAQSIKELIRLKKRITLDVSIFHSLISEEEIKWTNNSFRILPPLSTKKDKEYIQKSFKNASITALSSLHRPIGSNSKEGTFEGSAPGATSFETFLPALLKLAECAKISLIEAVGYITNQPAEILGIRTGTISKNSLADICIFDPNFKWKASASEFESTGVNSPFINQEMKGKVMATIANGQVIYLDSNLSTKKRTSIEV